ncbi:MAG: molybdate transport system permease protein, partial [Flavobacteriales bacterium]
LEIPMIVSPAALGAMILVFMSTDYGAQFQSSFFQVVFSPVGIVVAQLVTVMGISVRLIKAVIDEIPERYEQISRTLGASQWQSFVRVTLPLAFKGILASFILAWAKAFGEFGATITVAGAMPMKTETLPTSIFLRLSSADIEGTVVLILIIISIGVLALSTLRLVKKSSK